MEKINLIVILAAILLVGVAIVFKMAAPTGAAVAVPGAGLTSNFVTIVAIVSIAGIVVVTLLKKYD